MAEELPKKEEGAAEVSETPEKIKNKVIEG